MLQAIDQGQQPKGTAKKDKPIFYFRPTASRSFPSESWSHKALNRYPVLAVGGATSHEEARAWARAFYGSGDITLAQASKGEYLASMTTGVPVTWHTPHHTPT